MTEATIVHSMSLTDHNFIVNTLNKNPLGAGVMEVAVLIQRLNTTAQAVVDGIAAEARAKAEAAEKALAEMAKAEKAKAPKGARKTAVAAAAAAGEPVDPTTPVL